MHPHTLVPSAPITATGGRRAGNLIHLNWGTFRADTSGGAPAYPATRVDWYLNGVLQPAHASTYRLPINARGKQLAYQLTATKPGYTTYQGRLALGPVAGALIVASAPVSVTGARRSGSVVHVGWGSFRINTTTGTLAYPTVEVTWYLNGRALAGHATSLQIPAGSRGQHLAVRVKAQRTYCVTYLKLLPAGTIG